MSWLIQTTAMLSAAVLCAEYDLFSVEWWVSVAIVGVIVNVRDEYIRQGYDQ